MKKVLFISLALAFGCSSIRAEADFGNLAKASFKMCLGDICRFDIADQALWIKLKGIHVPRFPGGCQAAALLGYSAGQLAARKLKEADSIEVSELGPAADYGVPEIGSVVPLRPGRILADGEDLADYLIETGVALREEAFGKLDSKDPWCRRTTLEQ